MDRQTVADDASGVDDPGVTVDVPNRYAPKIRPSVRRLDIDPDYLKHRRVIAGATDPVTKHYETLANELLRHLGTTESHRIAVTSPTAGCGKSLTSVNLAICLASNSDQSIILVDLDLHRPLIQRYFSCGPLPGISDYLSGDLALDQILFAPAGTQGLIVLPGHMSMFQPTEMLFSAKLETMIGELETVDPLSILLVNLPPLLDTQELQLWSPYMEQVLLVIEQGGTTKDELCRAHRLLVGRKLLGIVMNETSSNGDSQISTG